MTSTSLASLLAEAEHRALALMHTIDARTAAGDNTVVHIPDAPGVRHTVRDVLTLALCALADTHACPVDDVVLEDLAWVVHTPHQWRHHVQATLLAAGHDPHTTATDPIAARWARLLRPGISGHSPLDLWRVDAADVATQNLAEGAQDLPVLEHTEHGHGWVVHGSRTVYDGAPWVRVDLAEVSAPDGDRFEHARVHIGHAAIALVVDESRARVLMLHRHRWVIDRDGFELLGGLVEAGEDPAETARRETLEESGFAPRGAPEHLLSTEPLPGLVESTLHIYLWRHGADAIAEPSDPHETGVLAWIPLAHIRSLADRGQLLGAGTALGLFRYLTTTSATG